MRKLCTAGAIAALGAASVLFPATAAGADSGGGGGAIVINPGSKPGVTTCNIADGPYFASTTSYSAVATPSLQVTLVCHFKGLTPAPASAQTFSGFTCGIFLTDSTGYVAITTDSTFRVTPSGNGTLRCHATPADVIFTS